MWTLVYKPHKNYSYKYNKPYSYWSYVNPNLAISFQGPHIVGSYSYVLSGGPGGVWNRPIGFVESISFFYFPNGKLPCFFDGKPSGYD